MSEHENIHRIFELQKSLKSEHQAYLNRYLSNAPRWVLESIQVVTKDKQTVFIEENFPAENVYILTEGTVRAIDYRIQGVAYDYMWFHPINVFGAMEIFFNMPKYMTTLMTVTPCTFLVLSSSHYEKWIWGDKNALQMETISMGNYLLEQNRKGRVFLFLQGMDRIIYMFVEYYEQRSTEEKVTLDMSRQELAERSGLSMKTVNRAVKKIEECNYVSRVGRKIIISKAQYRKMKEYLEPIVDRS